MALGRYALLDGELDGVERDSVVSHLASCSHCQQEYEADRRLNGLVREALSPSVPAPPALWTSVVVRIASGRAPCLSAGAAGPVGRRWRHGWPAAAALVGLVACLVVGALLLGAGEDGVAVLAHEIVADHLASLRRARGPADVASLDPALVIDRFRHRVRVPARVPASALDGIRLVGGSFCEFRSTQGLRWTYVRGQGRALSFYQLERPVRLRIPRPGAEQTPLDLVGTARAPIVLWGDEQSVYALVGELSMTEIRRLASLL
jgi:anti-sigma factor RsiW